MSMGKIMMEAVGLTEWCQTKTFLGLRTRLPRVKDGRYVWARIQILQNQRRSQRQRAAAGGRQRQRQHQRAAATRPQEDCP